MTTEKWSLTDFAAWMTTQNQGVTPEELAWLQAQPADAERDQAGWLFLLMRHRGVRLKGTATLTAKE